MADRLILVRHGETEWSRDGRHTGRTDLALTRHGEAEALASAKNLNGFEIERSFTSPLTRSRHTATLAGFPDAEPIDDLMEWDYGDHEGLTTIAIRKDTPEFSKWFTAPPRGESVDDVAARARRVITQMESIGGTVALFAHGHLLAVLIAQWLELPASDGRRFQLLTGSTSVLGTRRNVRVLHQLNIDCGA